MERGGTIAADKDHLRLDMADPPLVEDEILFFGRRSRRSGNTWVVSLFLVLQLVAFVGTMLVNDCPARSGGGDCALRPLGRFSFQLLSENPLLGPSSSTLVEMGALQRTLVIQQHQKWRILTSPWLHAGFIHLILNLLSMIFVGIHLEQDYGPSRTGMIYLLSALLGSVTSAIFIQDVPAVGSSGPLFGLIGATLAGLIRNRLIYADKFKALAALAFVAIINYSLGLLPHVNNFSNIGGFIAGLLLGFTLLYDIQLSQLERKKGLFDYGLKSSVKLKQKLDKPASRIVALLLFSIILAGGFAAVIHGVDAIEHCGWCRYINCVPTKIWSCNEKAIPCEAVVSDGRLILTCTSGERFRTFPFANVSRERMDDLCSLICS